jgi:hypothetical protein
VCQICCGRSTTSPDVGCGARPAAMFVGLFVVPTGNSSASHDAHDHTDREPASPGKQRFPLRPRAGPLLASRNRGFETTQPPNEHSAPGASVETAFRPLPDAVFRCASCEAWRRAGISRDLDRRDDVGSVGMTSTATHFLTWCRRHRREIVAPSGGFGTTSRKARNSSRRASMEARPRSMRSR